MAGAEETWDSVIVEFCAVASRSGIRGRFTVGPLVVPHAAKVGQLGRQLPRDPDRRAGRRGRARAKRDAPHRHTGTVPTRTHTALRVE